MRVLQLIDSLRPGGAEKMAVNIANALLPHVEESFLCCTRQEGMLKDEIKPEVGYLYLDKKSSLDPKAIFKLRNYILEKKIEIVHAHSTSFFLAGLMKLTGSRFRLIWHDHYGESEELEARPFRVLKMFSTYFDGIISVNKRLKEWAIKNINCKKVVEIGNFIPEPDPEGIVPVKLKGEEDYFKIICVANLRPQKDHFNLLRAFEKLDVNLNVSLHLIGEDPDSLYSASVLAAIKNSPVNKKIFFYGTQREIIHLLKQANLGVLASRSEGLPLALLEYGLAGLPVVCTNVGHCAQVLAECGELVEKENSLNFYKAILFYINNEKNRREDAKKFQEKVREKYSEMEVVKNIVNFYEVK